MNSIQRKLLQCSARNYREKKHKTMNFVCLASAENEWLCSGKEEEEEEEEGKKAEARKLQLIIS